MARLAEIFLAFTILCCAALAANAAPKSPSQNPQITVYVYNEAHVSNGLLLKAEKEANGVFNRASLDAIWVNCLLESRQSSSSGCDDPIESAQVVRIVPKAQNLTGMAFGVSFLGEDGTGRYADVFMESVMRLIVQDTQVNPARILGYVMAHEIGHLLLGSNAHCSVGIMQPRWSGGELRSIAKGHLLFTREQSEQMRKRVTLVERTGHWSGGSVKSEVAFARPGPPAPRSLPLQY